MVESKPYSQRTSVKNFAHFSAVANMEDHGKADSAVLHTISPRIRNLNKSQQKYVLKQYMTHLDAGRDISTFPLSLDAVLLIAITFKGFKKGPLPFFDNTTVGEMIVEYRAMMITLLSEPDIAKLKRVSDIAKVLTNEQVSVVNLAELDWD